MKWLRRIGVGLGGVVILVACAAAGAWAYGGSRGSRTLTVPREQALAAPAQDSATIARGEHLSTAIGKCVECHGQDLGGKVFIDDPALGRVSAVNLTTGKGGVLSKHTDATLERAIRHGVGFDGRPLAVMPSEEYNHFSDADVQAIIAYIRSRPPVDRELPTTEVRFVGRALITAGQLPLYPYDNINHATSHAKVIEASATKEYGSYLANTGGCTGCHNPNLTGGKAPGTPPDWKPAANITPGGIGTWTEDDFRRALREGVRPGGTKIDTVMPWRLAGKMSDEEIHALWLYLQSVPKKGFAEK